MNAYETLKERGFIYQLTDESAIPELLNKEKITFYIGIDPTADSLHVGHLLPLMAARWLTTFGHNLVIVIGGGTAMVGDPSGKTEMRQMLSPDTLRQNCISLENQMSRFLGISSIQNNDQASEGSIKILNNQDWLKEINYIEFLRTIGRHFSVNKMLTADSVKLRLETGLSFLEFNYMLLQAYDFFILAKDHQCELQLGGQDQWGNIVAGVDLIRRMLGKPSYGATFPLLTDRNGNKFGKSVEGAIWLDSSKTSVFDYYQFWRNVEDSEVKKLLSFYTTLPIEEVSRLGNLKNLQINRAKEILAFEATTFVHGFEVAKNTYLGVIKQYGTADPENLVQTSSRIRSIITNQNTSADLPIYYVTKNDLEKGIWIVKILVSCGLEKTNGSARRLIQGGGAYLNDHRISDVDREVHLQDFAGGKLILRSGKKNIRQIGFH